VIPPSPRDPQRGLRPLAGLAIACGVLACAFVAGALAGVSEAVVALAPAGLLIAISGGAILTDQWGSIDRTVQALWVRRGIRLPDARRRMRLVGLASLIAGLALFLQGARALVGLI
jgi:hypothetical protein